MTCSVFENDETVKGCNAGSSVEYCEPCFREDMEEDETVECNDSNESAKNRDLQKQEERSTKRKSLLWRDNIVTDPGLSLSPYMK